VITSSEPEPRTLRQLRRDRALRRAGLVALALFVLAGDLGLFGTRTTTTTGSGGGYRVEVEHAAASRPGHAVPFEVTVRRDGGFGDGVRLRLSSRYFELFDENAFDPTPRQHTAGGGVEDLVFDPPPGEEFVLSVDTRVEPARQRGERGFVAVLDERGDEVLRVSFRTRIFP
jgi:hypothetical protein